MCVLLLRVQPSCYYQAADYACVAIAENRRPSIVGTSLTVVSIEWTASVNTLVALAPGLSNDLNNK